MKCGEILVLSEQDLAQACNIFGNRGAHALSAFINVVQSKMKRLHAGEISLDIFAIEMKGAFIVEPNRRPCQDWDLRFPELKTKYDLFIDNLVSEIK